jgi:hypothetical protein
LAKEGTPIPQTVFIFLFCLLYFLWATTIRIGLRNPFFLTIKFNLLVLGALLGFFLVIFLIMLLGKVFGGMGNTHRVFILWSYSLLPTLFWFFTTSILYILLPPPRTLSYLGKIYSLVFIAFSLSIFFWKMILYYLTLRFGLHFDLSKIGVATGIITPIILGYSLWMYRLGIFRVPFI